MSDEPNPAVGTWLYVDGNATPAKVCIRSNGMTCPTHGTDHWNPRPQGVRTMNPSHKTETTTERFEWNDRDSKWEPVARTVEVKTHSE